MNGNHERDRSIEALLRRRGAVSRAPEPTADCLDAERAAAWFDGGLTPAERSRVEAHVADCAWCQALVGGMARTEPATPALANDPIVPRWLGWVLPLAAAAAIIVAVRVIPDETGAPGSPLADAVSADRREAEERRPAPGARAPAARPAEPPAVAQRLDSAPATPTPPLGRAADAASGRVQQRSAAEAPAAATESFLRTAAEILVASPAPEVRWRAGAASIDRTTDGGQTWRSSPVQAGAVIVAGAAPSATTCWLVGRGGLVLLTADGVTWESVRFPEPVDLTTVEAVDARTATVTTTDARRFRTTDGGRTWVRQPLQEN